jgi:hypothetical protein
MNKGNHTVSIKKTYVLNGEEITVTVYRTEKNKFYAVHTGTNFRFNKINYARRYDAISAVKNYINHYGINTLNQMFEKKAA